ncbi:MAG: VWA domain-containing protein [Planctomycetes bacterium]|nr:VWA domain-containing protein [Planctomycetota bacterium]
MSFKSTIRAAGSILIAAVILGAAGPLEGAGFLRGDADGKPPINITDGIHILKYLFLGQPLPCKDAADVNDSGEIGIEDAIHLLLYLFVAGPPPLPPFPDACGADPSEDALDCEKSPFSGEAVVYLIDRSGSTAGGDLDLEKREVLRDIENFSSCVEFGIIFYDTNLMKFPAGGKPVPASSEFKAAAKAFIQSVQAGHGTCFKSALLSALDLADLARAERKRIIFFSDGYAACPGTDSTAYSNQTLQEVKTRNQGKVPIHTVGIGSDINENFMKALAAQNNGTYRKIDR